MKKLFILILIMCQLPCYIYGKYSISGVPGDQSQLKESDNLLIPA